MCLLLSHTFDFFRIINCRILGILNLILVLMLVLPMSLVISLLLVRLFWLRFGGRIQRFRSYNLADRLLSRVCIFKLILLLLPISFLFLLRTRGLLNLRIHSFKLRLGVRACVWKLVVFVVAALEFVLDLK